MKKLRITISFLIALFLFNSCANHASKQNTISISGAFALYPLVVKWSEEYQKVNPDIRFNISGGGAGKGMADALSGAVDLGMFSREITQVEKDKGVWWVGLSIDAVVPTISSKNPLLDSLKKRGLTQSEFKAIFIDQTVTHWNEIIKEDQNYPISIYTRSDACGAAETWANYLGGTQEQIKGIGIYGDPGLAEAVSIDPMSIAFNNTIFVYDIKSGSKRNGIEVIPIDINSNGTIDPEEDFYKLFENLLLAIANGDYPSPPARELYFVAKDKPAKPAVLDFLKWTLTKGQAFVKEAGYVPIDSVRIKGYLNKTRN